MYYWVTIPRWLRAFYPGCTWEMDRHEKKIYLTFDDGPHPEITNFVLDQLRAFDARASFFCIGKNVAAWPEVFDRIRAEGHAVGNHTYHHLNGRKTADDLYLDDIRKSGRLIESPLFRPPYGRISRSQLRAIREKGLKPVMWSVLSADFDENIRAEDCIRHVMKHAEIGRAHV